MYLRQFIRQLIVDTTRVNKDFADEQVEPLVDIILAGIPEGFLPKKQIRQMLTHTQSMSIFGENKDSQLDPENFGNAIIPSWVYKENLSELFDPNIEQKVKKNLTSDNLNVYVRIPSTLSGGKVVVRLKDEKGNPIPETSRDAESIIDAFAEDTIPYTFRLEETLAATNLPALPHPDIPGGSIFDSVALRYSRTGVDGVYLSVPMHPVPGEEGVVWEYELGIQPPKDISEASIHYFFDVKLSQPVRLSLINPRALGAAIQSPDGTFNSKDPKIGGATLEFEIDSWKMPDPRNLQMASQSELIDELFNQEVTDLLLPIALRAMADPGFKLSNSDRSKLQEAFIVSAQNLLTHYQSTFNPLLSSVFTLPIVDTTKQSFWYANIDQIEDGPVIFEACVFNANGELVDYIDEPINVDYSAPEATINFETAEQATGYMNQGDVFVTTANPADPSALAVVNITSNVTDGTVGHGAGYLIYQTLEVDELGRPLTTWDPLKLENSMLASDLWELALESGSDDQLRDLLKSFLPSNLKSVVDTLDMAQMDGIRQSLKDFGVDRVIDALNDDIALEAVLQALLNPLAEFFGGEAILPTLISGYLGEDATVESEVRKVIAKAFDVEITDRQYALYAKLLGAVVEDLNLFPLTSDPSLPMTMPIQGENLPLQLGDYRIRALGIDTLFNVGSHDEGKHLRVVAPEYDKTRVQAVTVGDVNFNGKRDDYENGVIYRNTLEDVVLTVMVDERTGHPLNPAPEHPYASILVQYMDAEGEWQDIGPLELAEGVDAPAEGLEIPWKMEAAVFDALVGAGSVQVRTVTTNALRLQHVQGSDPDDPTSTTFTIKLDADVHPVDPKVLIADVDKDSIVVRSPDSGAPQGTITLNGYAARRTVPETTAIQVEVSMDGNDWEDVGTVEVPTTPDDGIDGAMTADVMFRDKTLAAVYDASDTHVDPTSSYVKWSVDVDTTALADSITKADPKAAHAASDPDMTYVELDGNRYMIRAYPVTPDDPDKGKAGVAEGDAFTEKFSVDNVDDVGPLGPTNVVATSTDGVNSVFVDNGDGTYTVGGRVDKYASESPVVTFTITSEAKRDTYASVEFNTDLPAGAIITKVTETAEGSGIFTVTVDVGTLMDKDDLVYMEDEYIDNPDKNIYNPAGKEFSFTVHALAYDADMEGNMRHIQTHDRNADGEIIDTVDNKITVNVQNTYRPDPGVLAIAVVNSDGMVNPDSGAPQGDLTFDVYTYGVTSAPTEGIRVEVRRKSTATNEWIDDTWERITGTAEPSVLVGVEEVPAADLSDIADSNAGITNVGVIGVLVGISQAEGKSPATLMKWSYTVNTRALALEDTVTAENTIKLDDTINRGDGDSERSVDADKNQYVVRAYALTPKNQKQGEYPKRDEYEERGGVEASFSLDNKDDVPPLGPTNITAVADHVDSLVANEEDGSYTARGIVDDAVESTKLTFSIEPTAELITYEGGMIKLVQTGPDGTVTELPSVSVDEGQITVDIGALANGAYEYYALVADEFGNWQVQGELDKPSPITTVHVLNFRVSDITDLTVTAVDGESPGRHELQETVEGLAGRYPLKDSIAVSFNVNNGSLAVGDLTGVLVDGHAVTSEPGDEANPFSLTASGLSALVDGWYTPHGRVTIRERFVDFPLATINLDWTGPMITIETPAEGHTVSGLPTLRASFGDGDLGSGVSDGSGVSAENTAVVSLARLRPEEVDQNAVSIDVDPSMVEQNLGSVVYTRIDKLAGGAYQFTIQVADMLGNIGEASVNFAVEGIAPTVVITAPASGQEFDASPASVTGFFAGGSSGNEDEDKVRITKFTVTVDGVDVDVDVSDESEELDVDGNSFTYTPAEGFSENDHTVSVEVTDGSGLTAQTALTFTVEYPEASVSISSPAAGLITDHTFRHIAGEFSGVDKVDVDLMLNDKAVEATTKGNQFTANLSDKLPEGDHTVSVKVKDANGETAEASVSFKVVYPEASVSISSPAAGGTYDHTFRHVSGEFTGVDVEEKGEVIVKVDTGTDKPEELTVTLVDNQFSATLSDKLPEGLEHKVTVELKDANGEEAEASATFSVVYPEASVSISSPIAGGTYDHTFRHISGEFTGVDVEEKGEVIVKVDTGMGEPEELTVTLVDNQFSATLSDKLPEGLEHKVTVELKDANGEEAEASATFSVVYPEASVSISSPIAGGTYDHTFRHISGEFTGVDVEEKGEVIVKVDTGMGEPEELTVTLVDNQFSATLSGKLPKGPNHTVTVKLKDANGEEAEASATFSVVYPEASVSISSPVAGDTYDHNFRHISGEFTGVDVAEKGEVIVKVDTGTDKPEELTVTLVDNQFSATLSGKLPKGPNHTVTVKLKDANGEEAEASATFAVVYPKPTVTLLSPTAGHTYTDRTPVISGEFTGVGEVQVKVTVEGKDAKVAKDGNQFTAEHPAELGHGMHTVEVEVTDGNKESAKTSAEFMVELPAPTVAILSPAPGQTYGHDEPVVIRVEATGTKPSITSFTINDKPIDVELDDDNMLVYTTDELTTDEYVVNVEVKHDANTETAQDTVVFNVKLDATPPVISEVAPSGILHNALVNISVVVSDEQSDITDVDYFIRNEDGEGFLPLGAIIVGAQSSATKEQIADGNVQGNFQTQGSFPDGTHTLQVVVTSEGGRISHTWAFTVVTDNVKPTITSITPSGTLHAGLPTISASAHDESGVAEIVITVMDSSGEAVEGEMKNDGKTDEDDKTVGITRSDFHPKEPLSEGTYSIEVRATDTFGNSSTAKGAFTIDFDTAAPLITSSSPQDGARLMYAHDDEKRPTISITYGDAETGVNVDSIRFIFNDKLINLTDDHVKSATQVIYMPPADLEPGQYTVKLEVSDNAQKQGNVSGEGARGANMAVYQFSFFVEHGEVPILKAAPFNYPNPFTDNTRISFVLARRSNVSITIFDVTCRPVRVLVDNEVMEAGYYTRAADGSGSHAIKWDGKSSNGEDLARGIYFCQIMVTDGIEPEYAILKLALTR